MAANNDLHLKFNTKDLEIRTKSIERTLEPLVNQVTTLVQSKGPSSGRKKGKSKRAHDLVEAVTVAIDHFLTRGADILNDDINADGRNQLQAALSEVKSVGDEMLHLSRDFADDPCSSVKRTQMVKSARALLAAVTRLLIVADMIDVQAIIRILHGVEGNLNDVMNANSQQELTARFGELDRNLAWLSDNARKRAADLKDASHRDDVIAARAVLKKSNTMLQSASKAYVRHPEFDPARHNRKFAYERMVDALGAMQRALESDPNHMLNGKIGDLARALDEFDHRANVDPSQYRDHEVRPNLEEELERIISGAGIIADSGSTRDERKNRIVDECNAVRQALQDLLSEYEKNTGKKEPSEDLDMALIHLGDKTRDLRRQLRRAIVDHISDSFLDLKVPIALLINAAENGDTDQVEELAPMFLSHASKMVEVANLACQMSNNEDGVKMVRFAAEQVDQLAPEVVNAARLLAYKPNSEPARLNMMAFKEAWEEAVNSLTMAVDSIITVDDFLAVSEVHILEDVHNCIQAVNQKDARALDHTAGAIRGRALRVCEVVDADMITYAPNAYTERVREAVRVVRDDVLPDFAARAQVAVDALGQTPPSEVDAEDLIDATKLVYDGIKDIRHAVLMNRTVDEIDSDEEYEYEPSEKGSKHGEHPDQQNTRAMMRELPAEEKRKIQTQVQLFNLERQRFDREVAKWDETGNDIIALAKHMCMIMMEMTDFTRGRGPLKTTMDVINAAKKISEAGSKLNKLANKMAEECVESESKKDLLAYLQRITLYCHQLNITSKVKADVQQVGDGGQVVVSGLESATSLIQSAKNLLNAVVLTVKSAYIANTKYPRRDGRANSMVVWRMRPPTKKPLIRHETVKAAAEPVQKSHGIIRRASQKRDLEPMKMLAEFQSDAV